MNFSTRSYSFAEDDVPVVIGEIGVNHNGDPKIARALVDAAVEIHLPVVKFQVFKTEKEISRFAELTPYQKEAATEAQSQFDLCKALEISHKDVRDLKTYCDGRGIGFLCSVFDFDSIDFLVEDLKVESLKIASGEVTNIPFLSYLGTRGVGILLSTGASRLDEVRTAVDTLRKAGCPELVLLHCVSEYPVPTAELNLRAIRTLRDEFGVPVGFSDHSQGLEAAIAAVALGATVIEKHFTLDRRMPGPDHAASAEPDDMRRLVEVVAETKTMMGDGKKRPMPCEEANRPLIRRSLVAGAALRAGQRLTREMIEIKRPASGITPGELQQVIGRELARDLQEDEPITWDCLK
jgi:N,N'-diacetyllegionaminate synthase